MKYRKKPVVAEVEAEQFFQNQAPWPKGVFLAGFSHFVITIHGQETKVVDGDWIIEEPDRIHYYPCKPDIFEATYEKVGKND